MEIFNGTYKVYCHTNKINGKKYIGITKTKVELRWHNGKGYKAQPKFYRAIEKYGWDNFEHEVIAKNLTEEEAKNFEMLMIEKLDCINNGYNVSRGGDSGNSIIYTAEMRKAISNRTKGKNNPRYGVHLEEETKNKISKALTGRSVPSICRSNTPMARKVYYNGTIYGSIVECAEAICFSPDTLQSWLSLDSKPPQYIVDNEFGYAEGKLLTQGYKRRPRHLLTICENIEY